MFLVTKERRQFIHQQERTKYILVHAENGSHEPEEAEARGSQVERLSQIYQEFEASLDNVMRFSLKRKSKELGI